MISITGGETTSMTVDIKVAGQCMNRIDDDHDGLIDADDPDCVATDGGTESGPDAGAGDLPDLMSLDSSGDGGDAAVDGPPDAVTADRPDAGPADAPADGGPADAADGGPADALDGTGADLTDAPAATG
jgi:hypothetical protein